MFGLTTDQSISVVAAAAAVFAALWAGWSAYVAHQQLGLLKKGHRHGHGPRSDAKDFARLVCETNE
jgi:hypothetical protein